MKLWVVGVLGLGLAGACTKANPAAKCTNNGTCTDPNFPFCDVDGSVGGQPGTCIAVTCTAGQFKSCSGSDTALVCDANGMTFDPMACVNGCADGSGCVTCTPNTQACANNVTTSCDGSGRLSTTTCALGCSADATHCIKIMPANGLGMYYDMTASPQDLDLESGTIDLDASTFNDGTTTTNLPSFDVPAPQDGAPIRVFVVKHLTLGDVKITSASAEAVNSGGIGRAVAFLATDAIDIGGKVTVQSGAISITGCDGIGSTQAVAGSTTYIGGGGGGGFARAGAHGGSSTNGASTTSVGGTAGTTSGNASLEPLRGGCPGGGMGNAGGAIQLDSLTAINITGEISADGWNRTKAAGGGAGGGILLEAPSVTMLSTGKLLARGAGGGAGNAAPPAPSDDGSAPAGGTCVMNGTACSAGGAGDNGATAAVAGSNVTSSSGLASLAAAGGGGGGEGRIRINTLDGMFSPPAGALVVGSLSAGVVSTQ